MKPISTRETAALLLYLLQSGKLTREQFQQMHHLHDTVTGFLRYCGTRSSFVIDGNNHRLHLKLEALK
jgi:hypothetical protein